MIFAGIVRTSQRIDYEETKQLEFTVVAYDSGVPQLSSSAKVTVSIINVNDQDPIFEQQIYNASVRENSPAGTHVIVVKAIDADEGPFGHVSYSLIGEHASDFNIGTKTNFVYYPIMEIKFFFLFVIYLRKKFKKLIFEFLNLKINLLIFQVTRLERLLWARRRFLIAK